jgi:hypothetical protein
MTANAVGGMTACPIAVILRTSFGPWEPFPGSFRIWGSWHRGTWSRSLVVRDLAGREVGRGLSAGERWLVVKASVILLQEADALRDF